MLKFIRGKTQQTNSADRVRLQRELFGFRKTVQHGFPNKPTCIAWDPVLRIMGVGTATGAIKVYGKPGVEFYGHHNTSDRAVTKMYFIPGQGRIISLYDTNSIHLWEINGSAIEETGAHLMEGKFKKISCMSVGSSKYMYLGTEGGNVFLLNYQTFEMNSEPLYQDVITQCVADNYKKNPGSIEAIEEQPSNPDNILIGYSRGLIVLWNLTQNVPSQVYTNSQQLENFSWYENGTKFISCHNDGSYILWNAELNNQQMEEPITVYGPFPCKAIGKIYWLKSFLESQDDLVIFTGGMQRASYSDRHVVTVRRNTQKTVAFDFSSKIIDILPISSQNERGGCEALLVLVEEELVCIDLTSDDWKQIQLPYLVSLHASMVTYSTHISDVTEKLWNDIAAAGKAQTAGIYSDREWPVNGGVICDEKPEEYNVRYHDILITGHEDGSVKFWNAGCVSMNLLYTFKTSLFFTSDEMIDEPTTGSTPDGEDDEDSDWPPFRKVGWFDPFSDDPRFVVKKVCFCPITGYLAIAGAAGQVLICKLYYESVTDKTLKATVMHDARDVGDNFVWKGYKRLLLRGCETSVSETNNCSAKFSLSTGYQPTSMLQLYPPAPITAVALHSSWSIVAAGTQYGLAIFDYYREAPVLFKSTLNANDLSALNEPPISRTKSFKKSLRESFRRIRKGRSNRQQDKRNVSKSSGSLTPTSEPERRRITDVSSPSGTSGSTALSPVEAKPVERAIEARPTDDAIGRIIRCLYFAHTFIVNSQHASQTLWAGTNNGTVYIFTISIPPDSKRSDERVTAILGKEIQLKHRAPVVNIAIIDGANRPLPEPFEIERGLSKPVDTSAAHHVIIASEEQFKLFSLPNLKPICKLKLTATEGARIRRMSLAKFSIPQYSESCILCLTNLGECIVLGIPELRRLITTAVIRREDINGISSLAFTKYGEALFLHSSSEMQRITLSSTRKVLPKCYLTTVASSQADKPSSSNDSPKPVPTILHVITNGIPEENEDEEIDSEDAEKKAILEETIKDTSGEEFKDISAITVDSVRDHLANLSINTLAEIEPRSTQESKTIITVVTTAAEATSLTTISTSTTSSSCTTTTVEMKQEATTIIKELTTVSINGNNNAASTLLETTRTSVQGNESTISA